MRPIVELINVTKTFPPATTAVADANLAISPGETIAMVGPSGSGKSTLLTLLGLLDMPTSGLMTLLGRDVSTLSDRERTRLRANSLGFVFQSFHLIAHLTALENVEHSLLLAGRGRNVRQAAIAALCDVGMDHRLDAFPTTLSGGEQQRVAIARALARKPRLLLCDEPTGNLDSATSSHIITLLTGTRQSDGATVVVTHDPEIASACPRRLHVLDGHVTELKPGSPGWPQR